jgi:WD40 repeat protein
MLLQGHEDPVGVVFSPDGRLILSCSAVSTEFPVDHLDSTLRLWDAAAGTQLLILDSYAGDCNTATFSPDGTRIVVAVTDGTIRLWGIPDAP